MQKETNDKPTFLNHLEDYIQEGIFVVDKNFSVIKVNAWMLSKVTTKGKAIGSFCYKIFCNKTAPCKDCPAMQTFESAQPNKELRVNPFGEKDEYVYEIDTFPILGERGEVQFVLGKYKNISHLKSLEVDFLKNKEKFKLLYGSSCIAYHLLDTEGKIAEVNSSWLKFLGYNEDDVLGKDFTEFMHADSIRVFEEIFLRFNNNDVKKNIKLRLVKKDGAEMYVSMDASENVFVNEKVLWYCALSDITSLTLSKRELNRNLNFTNALLSAIPNPVFFKDVEGLYVDCNKAFSDVMGVTSEQIKGKSVFDLWPSEQSKVYHENDLELMKNPTSQQYDFSITDKDNRIREVIYYKNVFYHEDNQVGGIVGSFVDITAYIDAQERLTRSELKFKGYIENSPYGIFVFDEKGSFIDINKEVVSLTGYSRDELLAMNIENVVWLGDRKKVELAFEKMVEINTPFDSEMHFVRRDGEVRPWYVRATKLSVNRFVAFANDITMRKEIELQVKNKSDEFELINEELKQANYELIEAKDRAEKANRLKTEFLNNMSHEIRTPMNGIIGFASMLEDINLSNEKKNYYLKIIQNSSKQLLRVIDDILEISTLETKHISLYEEEFCLNDLLMELFSIFNIKSKEEKIPIYLKKGLHDSQSYIISDKVKLSKILSNLIENALNYTNEGYVEVGYRLVNDMLAFYVKDTGIGISPKSIDVIFERFSQEEKEISKKHGGLGLGLSISKENALLLGGNIEVESEKGKGSTFYLSIPYQSAVNYKREVVESLTEEETIANRDVKILVAEDEEINYLYIEALFESEFDLNYTLIHAKNGKEAVDICQDEHIDIVLMDIKMPIMGGYEATERIKSKLPNLPIIAQTAYSTEADKKLALEHGCDAFLSKPIDTDKLFKLIYEYLNK